MSIELTSVEELSASARAEAKRGNLAVAESQMERALMRQVELNGGVDASNCLDSLLDLAHLAGLRGRDGRQAVLYKRALVILLRAGGDDKRSLNLESRQYSWLTGN